MKSIKTGAIFFYNQVLQRWNTVLNDKGHYSLKSKPGTAFEEFHSILCNRLAQLPESYKLNAQLGFHPKGKEYSSETAAGIDGILLNRIKEDASFTDGYMIPLKGETKFPINLFNLSTDVKLSIKYATLLQNGFYFNNLDDYYNYIALLRVWAPYSHLRIITIPAGTEINCRVGLVAPQSFPNRRSYFYSKDKGRTVASHVEFSKLDELEKEFKDSEGSSIKSLVENKEGGTQFYLVMLGDMKFMMPAPYAFKLMEPQRFICQRLEINGLLRKKVLLKKVTF